jgi:hypothetical protein
MSIEDALFRAIRPSAEALVARRKCDGTVDVEQIADHVMTEFRRVIALDTHDAPLRSRLRDHLQKYAK